MHFLLIFYFNFFFYPSSSSSSFFYFSFSRRLFRSIYNEYNKKRNDERMFIVIIESRAISDKEIEK